MTPLALNGGSRTAPLPCARSEVDLFLSEPSPQVIQLISGLTGPILILGAGGKMGLHLSLMLYRAAGPMRGDDVTAVSRFTTLRDRATFERFGLKTLACDLADEDALAALPDAPTVFYLAGVKFGTTENPALLQAANIALPPKIARRFRTSRIVAFSSGCVSPFVRPDSGGATEATAVGPVGDYAASCVAREAAFARASREHGTRIVLVRLNYSVEFRYGVLVDIAQKILAGEPVDVTTGHVNAIWQRDAIDHIIQSVQLAAAPAAPINVTGPEVLAVRHIAEEFGRHFGQPARFVGREAETALLNNASRSHRLFGAPRVSAAQMIAWIATWLQQRGNTWARPTGYEKRDGRY
jgi:nucleoside-diphosphate-sugar epimerase